MLADHNLEKNNVDSTSFSTHIYRGGILGSQAKVTSHFWNSEAQLGILLQLSFTVPKMRYH